MPSAALQALFRALEQGKVYSAILPIGRASSNARILPTTGTEIKGPCVQSAIIRKAASPPVSPGPPVSCAAIFSSQTVAIDGSGNAWIPLTYQVQPPPPAPLVNYFGLTEMNNSGTILSGSTGYNTNLSIFSYAVAIDSSGNVWSASTTGNIVTQLIGAATPVVTPLSVAAKNGALGTRH